VIRAAGGVLRRDGLIALVHRPRYDDWSLPKGKLEPGEDDAAAAVREILEETGRTATIAADLGTVTYTAQSGAPKIVRWYLMTAGPEVAGLADDVDEVRWLTADEAVALVAYATDREVLERARPYL
jgi:8-oxo-dGTP diphosphatase